jgi:hypothetical protein
VVETGPFQGEVVMAAAKRCRTLRASGRTALLTAGLSLVPGVSLSQPVVEPSARLTVEGQFEGKKDKAAEDLSGLACLPAVSAERRCLAVNDENRFAQFLTLRSDRITPGETVKLIGNEPPQQSRGRAPADLCGKPDDFSDFDGEGVAYAAPFFYVVGSHGCSRRTNEFRLSSFILARIRVDEAGRPGAIESTYRLSDVLRRSSAGAAFGKALMTEARGLNIEGIAVLNGTLWVGLRAPLVNGQVKIVGAPVEALFAEGSQPATVEPAELELTADPDSGVRDMAPLPDGRLLVLTGPAQEQEVPYRLFVIDPATKRAQPVGTLARVVEGGEVGKAEALAVIESEPLTVLVLFDGLKNGGPRLYRLTLPQ